MAYMIYLMLLILLVVHPVYPQLQPQSGCSYLTNAFESFCSRDPQHHIHIPSKSVQGPPGKRGAIGEKGQKGERGIVGSVAEVNYALIEDSIERKIRHAMESYISALDEANGRIKDLEEKQAFCPVKNNYKCFWMEVRHRRIAFREAESICAASGGRPADIYSRTHYEMISRYVRTLIYPGDNNFIDAWLGMKWNPDTQQASLSNGTAPLYVKWHIGYPVTSRRGTAIAFNVRVPWNANYQDMWNARKDSRPKGVICQK